MTGNIGGASSPRMIDCSVESSKTYADCEKKLGLELPMSFGAYQTKLGTNAYVVGKAPGKGEANVVVKDQNAGRGTSGGEAYHNTTLQAHNRSMRQPVTRSIPILKSSLSMTMAKAVKNSDRKIESR